MSRSVDLRTVIGSVHLQNPILTAAGTAGHGNELGRYMDLKSLGAVVAKSLSPEPWAGNPAPRLHPVPGGGMLNSVGLQNPGVRAWLADDLPGLTKSGATVIGGIWGRTPEEYADAARALSACGRPTGCARGQPELPQSRVLHRCRSP